MVTKIKSSRFKTDLLMLFVALIWGSAFSFQQVASRHVGAFLILGVRFLGAALLLLISLRFRLNIPRHLWGKTLLVGGLLFSASAFQQIAISITSVGNAGFITGMYVIFIPILLSFFWQDRLGWNVWVAVVLVGVGLYLLTSSPGVGFQKGDFLLLICALLYALQMIFLSQLVREIDPIHAAAGQFLVCGVAGLCLSFLTETNTMAGFSSALAPLVYITVFSTTIAYTLQGVAQKTADPTDAAIFLSMESVFAAIVGSLLLGETFSLLQIVGCVLMFSAMILSQVNFNVKKNQAPLEALKAQRLPGNLPPERVDLDQ